MLVCHRCRWGVLWYWHRSKRGFVAMPSLRPNHPSCAQLISLRWLACPIVRPGCSTSFSNNGVHRRSTIDVCPFSICVARFTFADSRKVIRNEKDVFQEQASYHGIAADTFGLGCSFRLFYRGLCKSFRGTTRRRNYRSWCGCG